LVALSISWGGQRIPPVAPAHDGRGEALIQLAPVHAELHDVVRRAQAPPQEKLARLCVGARRARWKHQAGSPGHHRVWLGLRKVEVEIFRIIEREDKNTSQQGVERKALNTRLEEKANLETKAWKPKALVASLSSASSDLPPSVVPGLRAFFRLFFHTVPVQKYWDYP